MREWRCPCCQRLLFRGSIVKLQIKCPRCKSVTVLEDSLHPVKSVLVALKRAPSRNGEKGMGQELQATGTAQRGS